MKHFYLGDVAPNDKAAEILTTTKSSLWKIAVIMVVLVWATRHYLLQ